MDGDLFRWVLLGVLAIGVLALLALLSTLSGIRKALERGSAPAAAEPVQAAQPAQAEPPTDSVLAAPAAEAAAATPVQAEAAPEPAAGYAGATGYTGTTAGPTASEQSQERPAAGTVETSQADAIRSVLAEHGTTAATPAAVDSGFAAHADQDEPEEEPFQRDGRWWFKRGGEFMVYDEASGQWQPTERPASWGDAPAASPPEAQTVASTAASAGTPAAASGAGGGFWKCPSCGAVNGSTAATCRMCFSARP